MPVGGVRTCTPREICVPPPAPLCCGFYRKGIRSGGRVPALQGLLKSPSSLQTNPYGSAAAVPQSKQRKPALLSSPLDGVPKITESENSLGWKGPLKVI